MDPIIIGAIVIAVVGTVFFVGTALLFRVWNTNIRYNNEHGIGLDPQYNLHQRSGYKPRSWWKIFFTA